ncbi:MULTISPECIES: alpha/beta fold hydrolase [unclassified Ensifer]|uniref:alpha/beta hydrolase family protein n=1 Tax=unclassified Ensifer TaxID=2633371 RepID=UPI0008133786|nr:MULTISPECIES: alpha/beta fold hydrolase [unclassified Ensifer]OCP01938.1 lipoprotein signal peptide [Ensifer sp. LC11]OCP01960.1 lipoprotein signal peptide [Ensifer sp. LC13]OCP05554.1 lipoprotein signal peptide [Ensifer sp. LC14]OCP29765.1 lipoprotein signal peptide [Ensifer sp. LC499]
MFRFSILVSSLWLSVVSLAYGADSIGFREVDLYVGSARPLHAALWYPSPDPAATATVGESPAFLGVAAVTNAATSDKARPLVVLSHGYGGSWRNLSWLAGRLVKQGYVVAAPDHPGTTTFNRDAEQAAMLWERPRDLSRVIDALVADPTLGGQIDETRIAAIGHSLGGWTVSALAGATFDRERFRVDCETNSSPRACSLSAELGLGRAEVQGDLGDRRLDAFVSLDLGLARGFSPESLARLHARSLVIGAGTDLGDMPAALESGYLAEHLSEDTSTYVEIPDAMHFSFMQLCKPGAEALIDEETPGDGVVCRDGGRRGRDEIHQEIAFLVIGFLAEAVPARP